jgi:hypothetical protein
MNNKKFKEIVKWARKNSHSHIISLYDDDYGIYRLDICQQEDENGQCGRYCNCSCSNWSRSIEISEMTTQQYNEIEDIIEGDLK